MKKLPLALVLALVLAISGLISPAMAQSDCRPAQADATRIVDRGRLKTVVGPLADFDPCHRSVRLDTPGFFATKRGDKPPLVIIAHGGGGLGGYEREFAKLLNRHGYATLVFDAFEMNGLTSGSDLLLYFMTNGARQRMIYKATLGAYRWALSHDKIDSRRIFFQGVSNGASVSINMAAAGDPAQVRGVIAEAGPAAGIGFPHQLRVPLLLVYGSADNYGGLRQDDLMHLRGMPCAYNDHDRLAPPGFAEACSNTANRDESMPSPYAWHQKVQAAGADVRFELVEGGGHGMLFSDFSASSRTLSDGRPFFRAVGAPAATRARVEKMLLDFLESRL